MVYIPVGDRNQWTRQLPSISAFREGPKIIELQFTGFVGLISMTRPCLRFMSHVLIPNINLDYPSLNWEGP